MGDSVATCAGSAWWARIQSMHRSRETIRAGVPGAASAGKVVARRMADRQSSPRCSQSLNPIRDWLLSALDWWLSRLLIQIQKLGVQVTPTIAAKGIS